MRCGVSIRRDFYANLLLAGGNTLLEGFCERLSREIVDLAAPAMRVKVIALQDRRYSTWVGGSILACLHTFKGMWITKAEYDDEGPKIVHRKCY